MHVRRRGHHQGGSPLRIHPPLGDRRGHPRGHGCRGGGAGGGGGCGGVAEVRVAVADAPALLVHAAGVVLPIAQEAAAGHRATGCGEAFSVSVWVFF